MNKSRNNPNMYPSIKKANDDFFNCLGCELACRNMTLVQFSTLFSAYLYEKNDMENRELPRNEDGDVILLDWNSYFKKASARKRATIDYGTALEIKRFLETLKR